MIISLYKCKQRFLKSNGLTKIKNAFCLPPFPIFFLGFCKKYIDSMQPCLPYYINFPDLVTQIRIMDFGQGRKIFLLLLLQRNNNTALQTIIWIDEKKSILAKTSILWMFFRSLFFSDCMQLMKGITKKYIFFILLIF